MTTTTKNQPTDQGAQDVPEVIEVPDSTTDATEQPEVQPETEPTD